MLRISTCHHLTWRVYSLFKHIEMFFCSISLNKVRNWYIGAPKKIKTLNQIQFQKVGYIIENRKLLIHRKLLCVTYWKNEILQGPTMEVCSVLGPCGIHPSSTYVKIFQKTNISLRKIPQFHLIFWCGNFAKKNSFRIVSGDVFFAVFLTSFLWFDLQLYTANSAA